MLFQCSTCKKVFETLQQCYNHERGERFKKMTSQKDVKICPSCKGEGITRSYYDPGKWDYCTECKCYGVVDHGMPPIMVGIAEEKIEDPGKYIDKWL